MSNRKNTVYYKSAKKICDKYSVTDDTKYVAMFFEMMAFQIFETILILSIASITGIFWESILVMIFFILARVGHLGQHARSLKLCVLYSTVMIIGLALISSFIGLWISPLFGMIAGVLLRKRN